VVKGLRSATSVESSPTAPWILSDLTAEPNLAGRKRLAQNTTAQVGVESKRSQERPEADISKYAANYPAHLAGVDKTVGDD
jgi:hypothetical protein